MWQPTVESDMDDQWVESTASLPIAFAQVREDPLIDVQLVRQLERPARVLMVASGGETAAMLSTLPLRRLHLVDLNEAQLNLTRLKLQLLQTADTTQRLALLGHTPMSSDDRSNELAHRLADLGLPAGALGPPDLIAQYGPDHCGRYEWLFARMRQLLADCSQQIGALMRMRDPQRQSQLVAEDTDLGKRIEEAFCDTMDLAKLVQIFGVGATANRVQPFAQHFLEQTRRILASMPAADNPFLHQIFLGSFIGPIWPWLHCDLQVTLPETEYSHDAMDAVLATLPDQSYDLIHLSNILDWINPVDAQRVLGDVYRCLSPQGLVVIRQLNSRLEIPSIPSGLRWLPDLSDQLHQLDRSFFYRSLHVGIKP
jgi:S-adenosylmethionine-diacylglycerol 3-amino-3-carboxypropyl transferase